MLTLLLILTCCADCTGEPYEGETVIVETISL